MCSECKGTAQVSNCTHHLMLIKQADVSGKPKETLFHWRNNTLKNTRMGRQSWWLLSPAYLWFSSKANVL